MEESGENAAAVAPEIKKLVKVLLAVLKTNTCWTADAVSEMITSLPSGETARTCPVTLGVVVTVGGLAEAATAMRPFCVPTYALPPAGTNCIELGIAPGELVSSTGFAAAGGEPLMGSRKAWQCTFVEQLAADFAAELATNKVKGVGALLV